MTLDGTNTWVIGEPGSPTAIVVDPGPDDEGHLRRVLELACAGDRRVARSCSPTGTPTTRQARPLRGAGGAPVGALDPALRLGSEGFGPGTC